MKVAITFDLSKQEIRAIAAQTKTRCGTAGDYNREAKAWINKTVRADLDVLLMDDSQVTP